LNLRGAVEQDGNRVVGLSFQALPERLNAFFQRDDSPHDLVMRMFIIFAAVGLAGRALSLP
jgi:hypothetical protein